VAQFEDRSRQPGVEPRARLDARERGRGQHAELPADAMPPVGAAVGPAFRPSGTAALRHRPCPPDKAATGSGGGRLCTPVWRSADGSPIGHPEWGLDYPDSSALISSATVQGCHVENLIDNVVERAVASIAIPSGVSSFDSCSRSMSSRSDGRAPNSSSSRCASRRLRVSRSTSRTKTPSNRPMKSKWFRKPPQKNVAAASRSATKGFDLVHPPKVVLVRTTLHRSPGSRVALVRELAVTVNGLVAATPELVADRRLAGTRNTLNEIVPSTHRRKITPLSAACFAERLLTAHR